MKLRILLVMLLASLVLSAPSAAAPVSAVLQAATREGQVVWYSSLDAPTLNALVTLFEQSHPGITVKVLRLGSSQTPARIMTERTAGGYNADVVLCDQFAFSQLAESNVVDLLQIADAQQLIKGTFDPKGRSVAVFLETTAIAFNPQRLAADGLKPPTSLTDLTKPEWKGKIGIDGSAFAWYQSVLATQKNGRETLQKIAANKPLITSGHTGTIAQLINGEFDVTPTAYGYMAETARLAGRPVDFVNASPVPVDLELVGILKNAPHPAAAQVLVNWLVSMPAQQYFVSVGRTPVRTGLKSDERVFNPKLPFYILSPPDRSTYDSLVTQFKALLGIAS